MHLPGLKIHERKFHQFCFHLVDGKEAFFRPGYVWLLSYPSTVLSGLVLSIPKKVHYYTLGCGIIRASVMDVTLQSSSRVGNYSHSGEKLLRLSNINLARISSSPPGDL